MVCATVLTLFGPAPAAADPSDDAKRASRAVDRAEAVLEDATAAARSAARRLELATAALPTARAKVATTRGVVAAARVQANTARRRADRARTEYRQIAGRFQRAQKQVSTARARVDEIASVSYMGGNIAVINVLAAAGPHDLIDRMGLVEQLMQKRQDTVGEVVAARRAARTEQDRAGLAKRAAEATERDAVAKLTAARAAENAAEDAQMAVIRLANSRSAALAVAKSQRAAVLAKYRAAKAEEDRVVAALQSWEDKNGGARGSGSYRGGTLRTPVHGWKTSDFGSRYDPYYRVWQLHAGVDLAAPGGSPIHAAADGRVIRAGWNGGYGNYTCISHGNRFSTCYGHQSKIQVYVGEHVRRGEVIGRVGTTGASTGYHLHFETRINGVPKNPLKYLPSCLC